MNWNTKIRFEQSWCAIKSSINRLKSKMKNDFKTSKIWAKNHFERTKKKKFVYHMKMNADQFNIIYNIMFNNECRFHQQWKQISQRSFWQIRRINMIYQNIHSRRFKWFARMNVAQKHFSNFEKCVFTEQTNDKKFSIEKINFTETTK